MKWTIDKPTKPGWYWWRRKSYVTCVLVDDELIAWTLKRNPMSDMMVPDYANIDSTAGEWAGPMEPPR